MGKTYRVVVTREDRDWLADVPALKGAHTDARSLAKLDGCVREVIVLADDLPDGATADLDLAYEYHIGDADLDVMTANLRAERARVEAAEKALAERTAVAANLLVKGRKLTVRDAAALLAVSPSRVGQVAPKQAS